MPKHPLISIIIVNYNGQEIIGRCIESVLNSKFKDFEIIIVDDHSTDRSVGVIKDLIQKNKGKISIKLIMNGKNFGPAKSKNVGISIAKSEIIGFLDNDVEVEYNWLCELIRCMNSDKKIAACASRLYIHGTDKKILNSAGVKMFNTGFAADIGLFELDIGQYDDRYYTLAGCTAASIYRRNVLQEVNYFDESFFYPLEDVDLGLKINLLGYKIIYCPNSIVEHRLSHTMGLSNYNKDLYLTERNRLMLVLKNFQAITILKVSPQIVNSILKRYKMALQKPETASYILRAHFQIIVLLFHILKNRYYIQSKRIIPDENLFAKNFIKKFDYSDNISFPDYKIKTLDSVRNEKPVKELIMGYNEKQYLGYGWYSLQSHEPDGVLFRFMNQESVVFFPELKEKYLKIRLFNPNRTINELEIRVNDYLCAKHELKTSDLFYVVIVRLPSSLIGNLSKINLKCNISSTGYNLFNNNDHRRISIGVSEIGMSSDEVGKPN
jgi:GT2 family glycosyltransferase